MNKQRANKNQKSKVNRRDRGNRIPSIVSQPIISRRVRFLASAAVNGIVTIADLFDTGLVCITSGTPSTTSQLYTSARLRRVELWAPPPSIGAAATVQVDWNQAESLAPSVFGMRRSDTSINALEPAFVSCIPPKMTQADWWHSNAAAVDLFTVVCPIGTVMDLHYDVIMADATGEKTAGPNFAGAAVAGQIYVKDILVNLQATDLQRIA